MMRHYKPLDFDLINQAVLPHSLTLLQRWLPSGSLDGREYKALNPKRHDRSIGSFTINIHNGYWADFAIGERGKGMISLAAYLFDLSYPKAAQTILNDLGLKGVDYVK